MRPSLKIAAGVLANLAMFSNSVLAYLPPIDFENYGNPGTPVTFSSPNVWENVIGQSVVSQSGEGFGGSGKALKIVKNTEAEAWLSKPVDWAPAEQIAFIDFRIKPAATPAGSQANFVANGSQLAFQLPAGATTGQLWVLHGNDDATGDPLPAEKWYLSAGSFTVPTNAGTSSTWLRATLRQDYSRKIWDLFIDGKLAAVNLGFDGRGTNLEALEFFGSRHGDTLIDNLEANPSNMLFPDADKDGLPDAWEVANGSNPNLYDRDTLKPGTNKSFLDHYLDSLWNAQTPGTPVNGGTNTGNVGSVPPLTILESHQPVGAIKGQFAVGGDGAAIYTIPIDIPKGRAGMEPKLSLNYSSNGGNGTMGVGWSLGGLQRITRGPSSLHKDGIADGADYDSSDRFFLDGERLICVNGGYGAADSEYRTATDSYSRIKAHGQDNKGPLYWTVESKAGLKMTFGRTADARIRVPDFSQDGQTRGGVSTWLVNMVEDTTGIPPESNLTNRSYGRNGYTVEYRSDTESRATSSAATRYPARIHYTIDPSTMDAATGIVPGTGFCSVEFLYGDRPDTTSGYVKGFRQEANKRLERIAVKSLSGGKFHLNHAYNLTYDVSEQTGRLLLSYVDKEGADGSRVPGTTFQWETLFDGDAKWEEVGSLDFNEYGSGQDSGSSMASFVSVSETDPTEIHLTGNAWRTYPLSPALTVGSNTWIKFDYRTLPDVGSQSGKPKWGLIGFDEDTSTASPKRLFKIVGGALPPVSTYNDNSWEYTRTDGLPSPIKIRVGQHYTGVMNYLALVNDDNTVNDGVGESWFKNIRVYNGDPDAGGTLVRTITFDQALASPRMMDGNNEDLGVRVQDINGDGLPDIAYNLLHGKTSGTGAVTLQTFGQALRNTGSDFVNDSTLKLPPLLPTGNLPGGGEGQFASSQAIYGSPIDINGDGQVDYAYAKNLVRDGNGYFTCEHGYMTRENGAWVDLSEYSHHFKSTCATSQKRFSHFEHIDLDSDGDLDVVVHPYGATLSLLAGKPNTDPATFPLYGNSGAGGGIAYLNRFREGDGWVASRDWSLKVPLRIPGFNSNGGEVGRGLQDLDGDGRPDMYSALWQDNKDVWLNSGTGWLAQTAQSAFSVPENITNSGGDDVGTRFVDVNGDGNVDVLKALGSGSMNLNKGVHLNTGSGWLSLVATPQQPIVPWLPEENFNTVDKRGEMKEQGTSFVDLNADGMVDFVVSKPSRDTVFINTGKGWRAEDSESHPTGYKEWKLPSPIYPNTTASTNGIRHAMLVDLNGDGVSDLIGDMKNPVPKIWINKAKPERIISITDGFASQIQVNEYRRLNDPEPVANDMGRRVYDKTPLDDEDNPFDDWLPGHVSLCDNRWVVARYSEPDGMGGRRYRSQYYRDLRHDKVNETSLGFGAVEVHDEVTGGYSVTYSHRQYPHGGSPIRAEKYVKVTEEMDHQDDAPVGDRLISRELSKYGEMASQAGVGGTIRRPVQIKSVGQKFDLDGTLMSVVVTDLPVSSYDAFGFVTSSTVVSLNVADLPAGINLLDPDAFSPTGSMVHKSVTATTYSHGIGAKWLLGRSNTAQVTLSRPGFSPRIKTTAYTYDADGLIISETVQPNDPLYSTTVYTRDDFGNVTESEVTANVAGANTPQTRAKLSAYDADGRFVTSETVPGLGTTTYHYDSVRCLMIGTTDLNGRTTSHAYDSFGTKIADNFPDGTRAADITRFASNADLPSQIRSIIDAAGITIRWARVKEVSGVPAAVVYIDTLGRDIVTKAAVLTSAAPSWSWQYQIKLYDEKGREYLSSNSFLGETSVRNPFKTNGEIADTTEWTRIGYDVLDRAIETTHPDLTVVETVAIATDSLTVSGLASQPVAYVKVRNQRGKDLERWLDAEGRLVQSRDASAQITRFNHDLEGRVREVTIDNAWQLTNEYDIRGNRTMVNDLSAGRSDSLYNGFGELWWTKNAKNERVENAYDAYGRVTTVTRPDDESLANPPADVVFTNTYIGSGANKGKLATVSNPKGYLETYQYGESAHDYGKIIRTTKRQKAAEADYESLTTYNALGLPLTETDAGGLKVVHQYESLYGSFRLKTVLDDSISTQVWKAPTISRTSDRHVTTEELSHGVVRVTKTEATNGRIREIQSTGLGRTLQDLAYTWDQIGNLLTRTDNLSTHPNGKTETFDYDELDRLKSSRIGNGTPVNCTYETNGNLKTKDDGSLNYYSGTYRVQNAKVKGASSDNRSYGYDAAGQVEGDGRREYKWTAFGQLKEVKQTSTPALEKFAKTGIYSPHIPGIDPAVIYNSSQALSFFEFDAGGARSKQTLKRTYVNGSYQEVITRYLGSFEIEEHGTWNGSSYVVNKSIHRHRIGGALYTSEAQGGAPVVRLAVILTDHIGSTDVIVRGEWGGTGWKTSTSATDPALSEPRSERQSFDAWGERRHGENWSELHASDSSNRRTSAMDYDRGFTGHEMLDDFGLVHMNGRIYDPEIGRFLSPDPYVQVPEYSQNFNRYSYVLNNPLSYTDSSGHEVDGLVVAAVSIVVGIVTAGIASAAIMGAYAGTTGVLVTTSATAASGFTLTATGMALVGGIAGAFAGAVSSAMTGQNVLEGALEGAISGAITGGLLHGLEKGGSLFKDLKGLSRGIVHVAGHGLLGGIRNEVMGGRFQDGFLSALAGAAAGYIPGMENIAGAAGDGDPVGIFTRSMIAGVIGGTASAIGGGKFANGAYTAAFQHLLNSDLYQQLQNGGALNENAPIGSNFAQEIRTNEGAAKAAMIQGGLDAASMAPLPKVSSLTSRLLGKVFGRFALRRAASSGNLLVRAAAYDSETVRRWYLQELASIPQKIDSALPLKDRALNAFSLRTQAKITARNMMSDRAAAELLNETDPIPTIADMVKKAYAKGHTGDDVWSYILNSSQRSRKSINDKFGL